MNIYLNYHNGRKVVVELKRVKSPRGDKNVYWKLGQAVRENGDPYPAPEFDDVVEAWWWFTEKNHIKWSDYEEGYLGFRRSSIHDRLKPVHNVGPSGAYSIWAIYQDGYALIGHQHMHAFEAMGTVDQLFTVLGGGCWWLLGDYDEEDYDEPVTITAIGSDSEMAGLPPQQWGDKKTFSFQDLMIRKV